MQHRSTEFTLEPINNIATNSTMSVTFSDMGFSPTPPPISNGFKLLNGDNFLLLNGDQFLLLGN